MSKILTMTHYFDDNFLNRTNIQTKTKRSILYTLFNISKYSMFSILTIT